MVIEQALVHFLGSMSKTPVSLAGILDYRRGWLSVSKTRHRKSFRILSGSKQFDPSVELSKTPVLPPGFEPGTTASKAAMISISPRERKCTILCIFRKIKGFRVDIACETSLFTLSNHILWCETWNIDSFSWNMVDLRLWNIVEKHVRTASVKPALRFSEALLTLRVEPQQRAALGRTALCLSVRAGRIELPSRPWQGRILPLNHARKICTSYMICEKLSNNKSGYVKYGSIYGLFRYPQGYRTERSQIWPIFNEIPHLSTLYYRHFVDNCG